LQATFAKSKSVTDVKLSRKGVIYKITDFLLAVDLQDYEIIAVWKGLKVLQELSMGRGQQEVQPKMVIFFSGSDFFRCSIGWWWTLGFATGFAIKKIMKLAFIILGLFALVLGYLEYQKIISVNWTVIENQTSIIMTHAANKIAAVTQHMNHEVPVAGLGLLGFAPGLALGLMRG